MRLILILLSLQIALSVSGCESSMCANQVLQEIPSPDNKLKAVVFQRDCGATTGFSTQVSVIKSDEKLSNTGGNVFSADTDHGKVPAGPGGGPYVNVNWIGFHDLEIIYPQQARKFQSVDKVAIATGLFKSDSISVKYRPIETKLPIKYSSPDGKYIAIVVPLPHALSGVGESKIEIHSKDAILSSAIYSSEDGEHGFGVEQATWSPDSKFFVYSMSSSGGHQSWHFPTYFISVNDFKTRYLDDYVGSITQPEIAFSPPDIIQVFGHTPRDFEKETEIKASLSKLLKK